MGAAAGVDTCCHPACVVPGNINSTCARTDARHMCSTGGRTHTHAEAARHGTGTPCLRQAQVRLRQHTQRSGTVPAPHDALVSAAPHGKAWVKATTELRATAAANAWARRHHGHADETCMSGCVPRTLWCDAPTNGHCSAAAQRQCVSAISKPKAPRPHIGHIRVLF